MKLHPLALYWAPFNHFELRIPGGAVTDIATGGNGFTVAYWAPKIKNEWPDRATPDAIRAELREYGAWDDTELADDAANWGRLIWQAAHGIAEHPAPGCEASVDELARLRKGEAGGFEVSRIWGGAKRRVWEASLRGAYLATFPTRKHAREAVKGARLYVLRDAGSLRPIHEVAAEYLNATP